MSKKITDPEEVVLPETEAVEPQENPVQELEASPEAKAQARRRTKIHAMEGDEITLSTSAQRRNDLIDLAESQKSNRIMTGVIQGVEHSKDNYSMVFAVLYHGAFKIIIPAEQLVEADETMSDSARGGMVMRRLGAEIDYVIVGVDNQNNIAAGSRIKAMAQQRRNHFLKLGRDGTYPISVGDKAEARIVSVIPSGVFVELFGVEQFVPMNELSYQRWVNAAELYHPGEKVLVRILELERTPDQNVRLSLSIKQAYEDRLLAALRRFVPDSLYFGSVSMITTAGVFVSFGDVGCLCKFPRRGRPSVGAPVTVRILGMNLEEKQLWGVIIQ